MGRKKQSMVLHRYVLLLVQLFSVRQSHFCHKQIKKSTKDHKILVTALCLLFLINDQNIHICTLTNFQKKKKKKNRHTQNKMKSDNP